MSLTIDDVNNIAYLARIGINAKDVDSYARDLSGILDLVAQMAQVNTEAVDPMSHPLDQVQRLRPDVVKEQDQHEKFQTLAPQVEADLYLVPKVIE